MTKRDDERMELQRSIAMELRDSGHIIGDDGPTIWGIWEIVETHYASKCADHEQSARAEERELVLDCIESWARSRSTHIPELLEHIAKMRDS